MVQGQGQTTGQLQVIPQGVTVIPGPGQQLMQAALPNGQMQRFLFTPVASASTPTSSTGMKCRNTLAAQCYCFEKSSSKYPPRLSSHHTSRPTQRHLYQKPRPACSTSCRPGAGRGDALGHHQCPFIGHPTGPVTPPDATSHAHPVPDLAAGENAGRNGPAAAAADAAAHQHVRTAAAGSGTISREKKVTGSVTAV